MTPHILEHRIPTPDSRPYIVAAGSDGCVWFCESGPGQIGRLSVTDGAITEFALPNPTCTPIGVAAGVDGAMWFTESKGHKVGRITLDGAITEFDLPTPESGPNGIMLGPDGNIWFAEHTVGKVARITPGGKVTEFGGFSGRPLAPTATADAVWFSDSIGSIVARVDMDGHVTEFAATAARQRPARHHPGAGWQYLVRAGRGQCDHPHQPGGQNSGIPAPHAKRQPPRHRGRPR
ncbi:MAG: virginiamycin lyase [Rhodopila sp.]|nr:virginiamycin lyase [Rhodopila sp.]